MLVLKAPTVELVNSIPRLVESSNNRSITIAEILKVISRGANEHMLIVPRKLLCPAMILRYIMTKTRIIELIIGADHRGRSTILKAS